MSYHVVYLWPDPEDEAEEPRFEEGDTVASGTGYANWLEWTEKLADKYPACDGLAEYGFSEELGELERELHELLNEPGADENLRAVTASLLAAVRDRPAGAVGMSVTDGSAGDPDEEEGED